MNMDHCGTWLEINSGALKNNYRRVCEIAGVPVMAVVKANGYGHGLTECAKLFQSAGAEWFGTARFEEALTLREAGLGGDILVLGYTCPSNVPEAIRRNISLNVYDEALAGEFASIAAGEPSELKVHAKIDSGMGRLGVLPEEAGGFIYRITQMPGLMLEGVFTHFAVADEPFKKEDTYLQLQTFNRIVDDITREGLRPTWIHASNSAATINVPEARFDLVRPGIILYGLVSDRNMQLPDGFSSAMSWKSRIGSIKNLPKRHGVSYGLNYHTRKEEKIGVIAAGYGDGLRRQTGNQALVGGKRVAVIGNVCMDQCMVQLDGAGDVSIGDEVVLMGVQGEEAIPALELAERWGTITNEVVCGMAKRLPRIYLD